MPHRVPQSVIGLLLFAFGFVAFIAYAIVSAVFQVSASFKF